MNKKSRLSIYSVYGSRAYCRNAQREARDQGRPGRNERRKARTRNALLAAGQRLFGERGFDATTVAEIAEAADVAIGSFYNYFDTKDELLAALLQETLAEHLRRMQARRAGIDDPAEAISVAHRHFVRLAWEDPSGRGCSCAWMSPTA